MSELIKLIKDTPNENMEITLGQAGSSCAKVKLVRPQEFCFAFTS